MDLYLPAFPGYYNKKLQFHSSVSLIHCDSTSIRCEGSWESLS